MRGARIRGSARASPPSGCSRHGPELARRRAGTGDPASAAPSRDALYSGRKSADLSGSADCRRSVQFAADCRGAVDSSDNETLPRAPPEPPPGADRGLGNSHRRFSRNAQNRVRVHQLGRRQRPLLSTAARRTRRTSRPSRLASSKRASSTFATSITSTTRAVQHEDQRSRRVGVKFDFVLDRRLLRNRRRLERRLTISRQASRTP